MVYVTPTDHGYLVIVCGRYIGNFSRLTDANRFAAIAFLSRP